ncbi:neural proliferation differentiation and control protein 1-like [Mercenaria mercenaria]|uniref:neural proliferation differentiation and control protein 1-like n=1 Tax=Mercenaria mercenaria TaxID=6596 RepID=UPI00234F52B3|nr:neural proliferation differentiation and control protein 1-like [Mercenaria mercenaria]
MDLSKMFLLPLLAGILLVLQGPGGRVLGARNSVAAKELKNYMDYLDELNELSLFKRILATQNKRQNEQYQAPSPRVDYSDKAGDSYLENKALEGGINFAAGDNVPETNLDVDTKDSQTKGTTGTSKPSSTNKADPTHDPPSPPEKLTAEKSGSIDAISKRDFVFLTVVSACSVAGLVGLIMAGVCWYKLHKRVKAAGDVDYPAYGVTGPTKERLPSPGDRKLAQSAQMYHYQHQKQQMIAMEKANGEMKHDASDDESEEENEEGDYTVYECPGLAPTGEMEVRNPLFTEDAQTPVNGQSTTVNGLPDDHEQK